MQNQILFLVLIIVFFSSCNQPKDSNNMLERELSTAWKFQQANGELSGNATIPGTIHTDMLNEAKIEDPFYRTNEKDLQWIDKVDWIYSTILTISEVEFNKENLLLHFKGLDTYADVYLNNELLLEADNMFREWEVDLKKSATLGNNELKIYFHSPIQKGLLLLEAEGHAYPASNDQSENGELGDKKVSVFTRKAGYHYGWDWGPRFVTSGIWRPVVLKAWDSVRIKNTYIKQINVTAEKAEIEANVTINASTSTEGKIVVIDKANGKILAQQKVKAEKGSAEFSLPFTIESPTLWWSNGLGEAHLYDFEIQFIANNTIVAKDLVTTGLRSLKLVREKDEKGESFLFELNGVRVFAKGANYIPNDNFLPRVTNELYEKVISDAVNANMNMLRIWGGGIYENDYFYELCDKNGIMVWQDFMFACSMYPGNDSFIESIKQEAIDNVVRIRNHPSIALWCGNNEINTAWQGWGWKNRYTPELQEKLTASYLKIFHEVLPQVVKEYTFDDDYWPSSPQGGYEPDQHAGYGVTSGDMHYWGVWHGLHPFEDFEVYNTRFMSEFGFQSFPDFETVQTYALPEDYDIESTVMAAHQRSGIGNLRIKEYMSWYFNVPSNFEDFLYMSHVLQAYGMRKGIEAHRRAMPYCMGTLYWQINDCWQVASWSSTDYFHKWKAMHYDVKRAFEDLLISAIMKNDTLEVYGISEQLKDFNAKLQLSLIKFDGTVLKEETIPVQLIKNESKLLFSSSSFTEGFEKSEIALKMEFVKENEVLAQNLFFFNKPKELNLPEPKIEYTFTEENGEWYIELESDKLARYVMLNIPDQNEFFTDNYFDLIPNVKKKIKIEGLDIKEQPNLQIKHLQQIQ